NQGGCLSQAVSIADMFIHGGYTLVSRQGRQEDESEIYRSTNSGTFPLYNLIVLINGGSASASEIVAGAVQDLDRGLIVGENSFGKGLVQRQFMAGEGAVIRISTSHWYTPAGRLVQRPYDKGRGEYYAVRYRDPDSQSADSTREEFKTLGGRTVYASSGITPDHQIEGRRISGATIQLLNNRLLFEYAQTIADNHNLTENSDFQNFYRHFNTTDDDIEGLLELAVAKELEYPPKALESDGEYLKSQLKAEVAQLVWSSREGYYLVRVSEDPVVKSALELFEEADNISSSVWR
ncbi:MAG: S41 family peptidase, partial [Candidatus Electryoneaceae bacterium]|nr:S41 family peptidase [Candidatus Electryoneaceae bacterium]